MSNNKNILLVTEGTYPYKGGGVSTWAHYLTQNIKDFDFSLYALTADVEYKPIYDLGTSVKEIVQIPVWSPEEPYDCVDYNEEYKTILMRREMTTYENVQNLFVPHFKLFLENTFKDAPQTDADLEAIKKAFIKMWQFFNNYDYKSTLRSESVWNSFNHCISKIWPQKEFKEATLQDMSMGIRLIYRFLIPLAIDPPKSDITHLTIAGTGIIPALKNKEKYGAKTMLTEHGVFIRERMLAISKTAYSPFLKRLLIVFSEMLTRLTYRECDRILTVSKFNIEWALRYGAKKEKVNVVYNGVESAKFIPAKITIKKDRPTVVAAARIFDLKDIITMIKVCAEVRKSIPNVLFLVYGNKDAVPEYTEQCENLISELALEDHFKLAGFHNKPQELFLEGDISILTSISEGFPYTVIESMSCSIPVVATDVGGVTEALTEECGFVCKPRDFIAIADKVVAILKDDILRKKMGEAARKRVLELFTIEQFIALFEKEYQALVTPVSQLKKESLKQIQIA
ncbi:GT4 family glycosyltransferase PelF [Flavobacterium sp. ASW18X]|uniref:GT4 family glycosyltransferase PelF n=1 Tax=Flavobacterium sp. ASW18X TaxID=2572595 RepID=UPI0010AE5CCA|nr:GT4 family glycosyltransferase PelF [Flavobacterium sp. ASW18X]TKD67307.1 DUF3492 domain-containing protein [Flavobacterium sp. ASW18X]